MSLKSKIITSEFLMAVLLVPLVSFAGTAGQMRCCSTWKSRFVDAGFGEDVYTSSDWTYRPASYTHFEIVDPEDDEHVYHKGILDDDGCTPYYTVGANMEYKFRQATWLERPGGREFFRISSIRSGLREQ